MCLVSREPFIKKIAKEDILTYKVLYVKKHLFFFKKYYALYHPTFRYKFNKLYTEELKYTFSRSVSLLGHYFSTNGLYSYLKHDKALKEYSMTNNFVVVECIIPKGSEYITNGEEIVSNQIIIKRCVG